MKTNEEECSEEFPLGGTVEPNEIRSEDELSNKN